MTIRNVRWTLAIALLLVSNVTTNLFADDQHGDWEGVYFANYVELGDLPTLADRGINCVLMEFGQNPRSWQRNYDALQSHDIRVVPVLWGKHQSIWKWNSAAKEWELDSKQYPKSKGAKFIQFLKSNPDLQRQTFAIYSFHEPWYIGDKGKRKGTVRPEQQRKFWTQIREIFDGRMKVYGEEVSWVPECKNGCVDYDYVTLYSFAKCDNKKAYRPGGRFLVGDHGIDGAHAPCEFDVKKVIQAENQQIQLMHQAIQSAPPASDGTRTKLIALMGTFSHDEEPDLWNRMPTADEMKQWGREIIAPSRTRLAGMGWYAFRNPTDYYKEVLSSHRKDPSGQDRWAAIGDIFRDVFVAPTSRRASQD